MSSAWARGTAATAATALQRITRRLRETLAHWEPRTQFLGRYSIEKLCVFHEFQAHAGILEVLGEILWAPCPLLLVILGLEAVPLGDPHAGLRSNVLTLIRSGVSHVVLIAATLLSVKRSLQIPDAQYSLARLGLIAVLGGLAMELVWLPAAVYWRYPVPFREFAGVGFFALFVVGFNWLLARDVIRAQAPKLRILLPVLGIQLSLFYAFLGLSIAFAQVPLGGQIAMIATLQLVKVVAKNLLWRLARRLDDVSTDVTICVVEMSGALYQTVCLQYANTIELEVVIMALDFLQALYEVRAFMGHEYHVDNQRTLATAVKIIESALHPGRTESQVGRGLQTRSSLRPPSRSSWSAVFFFWGSSRSSRALIYTQETVVATGPSRKPSFPFATQRTAGSFALAAEGGRTLTSEIVLDSIPRSAANALETAIGAAPTIIDGLRIVRRDQARVLQQSLQLLFACEVLVFVEFMEMFVPLVYGTYVGVAWHLPNARYSLVLRSMTRANMYTTVITSFISVGLELVSFLWLSWLLDRRYGISPLRQLAFVLRHYRETIHGKLIGCFITIVLSATVHQGMEFLLDG